MALLSNPVLSLARVDRLSHIEYTSTLCLRRQRRNSVEEEDDRDKYVTDVLSPRPLESEKDNYI